MYRQVKVGELIEVDDEILDMEHQDAYQGNYFHRVPSNMVGTKVQYKTSYIRRDTNAYDLSFKLWR